MRRLSEYNFYLEQRLPGACGNSLFELIIVIHEWGHFTAARLMKIKVNEFSVGMGPKLLQHKGKKQHIL